MPGNNNISTNNNNLSENNNIESFYEDNNAQFATGNMKRPVSLDLNTLKNPAKKQRLNQSVPAPLVLESPDLQSLKFNTPDLEKFILSSNLLQTPTPGLVFPTKVTTEQEDYAKGFVDALNSLRNSDNPHSNGMSGGSITYTNLDESFPVAIKDEPQTGPSSPPVSPIDMETQERIKLERKRQRNRVAASKCRKRKLERISKLEDKVKILKGENADLASVVKQLKDHVFQLKQQVIEHIQAGCNISVVNGSNMLSK